MKRPRTGTWIGSRLCALTVLFFGVFASLSPGATRGNATSSSGNPQSRTIKFRAISASGLFAKTLTLRGTLAGETEDREFARIRYPGLNQPISSHDWIKVENVSAAYLQMEIDPQFAMPGIHLRMRSDDPTTSHYLFHQVGDQWIQAPHATKIDVFSYAGCGRTEQSWEDGGDFHHQDFFFEIEASSDCAVADASSARRQQRPELPGRNGQVHWGGLARAISGKV